MYTVQCAPTPGYPRERKIQASQKAHFLNKNGVQKYFDKRGHTKVAYLFDLLFKDLIGETEVSRILALPKTPATVIIHLKIFVHYLLNAVN